MTFLTTWERHETMLRKNWKQPTWKGKWLLFFVGQFLVLHYQKKKLPQEVLSMSFTSINFFSPQILYPFQFVILVLQIFEKKPLVSKLFFYWRSKIHFKKKTPLEEKQMTWLNIHTFSRQNRWLNAKVLLFKEISSFFFPRWLCLNNWIGKKMELLVNSRFWMCLFFFPKLHECWKKKD